MTTLDLLPLRMHRRETRFLRTPTRLITVALAKLCDKIVQVPILGPRSFFFSIGAQNGPRRVCLKQPETRNHARAIRFHHRLARFSLGWVHYENPLTAFRRQWRACGETSCMYSSIRSQVGILPLSPFCLHLCCPVPHCKRHVYWLRGTSDNPQLH